MNRADYPILIHSACGINLSEALSPTIPIGNCMGRPGQLSQGPSYQRRSPEEGGRSLKTRSETVTNRDTVPNSPFLSLKYNAHIKIETCVSATAAKYVFKYVLMGRDRTMVQVEGEQARNEVVEFEDRPSIGSSEATWRLYSFKTSERHPAVYAIRVHLPEQQTTFFEPEVEQAAVERESFRKKLN